MEIQRNLYFVNFSQYLYIYTKKTSLMYILNKPAEIPTKRRILKQRMKRIYSSPFLEYIKLDRDKSTFKSHRDFSSEKEITFKHF